MDKIDAFNGFFRVFGQQNFSAGFFGDGAGAGDDIFRRPQGFRRADTHVHAELRTQHQQRICHVVTRVADVGKRGLVQRFGAVFAHGQRVGEHLGGMKLVGQAVEHGHAGVFRQFFDHVLPEAAIFDAVVHPAQHAGGVFDAFLMPDLAGGRLQISDPRPLVARGDFKRAAGAGRCFFKNQGDVLPFHPLHFAPCLFGGFQFGGKVEVGGDFFGRKV